MTVFLRSFVIFLLLGTGQRSLPGRDPQLPAGVEDLNAILEPIRAEADLPALAAAVIEEGRLTALGAVGERRQDSGVAVTPFDQFHLGSDTKAMTATVAAILIEERRLTWETTVGQVFTGWADEIDPGYRRVTLRHLLSHRAGCPEETAPPGMTFNQLRNQPGTLPEQRLAYTRAILTHSPEAEPESRHIYSNAGYVVAGTMLEVVTGTAWEDLMREKLFAPLGMASAGFGVMGRPGPIEQPWQHQRRNGRNRPVEPQPQNENPPVIGPAGIVHCSLPDWAKFVIAHLDGRAGQNDLLPQPAWERLQTPPFGGEYAMGWGVVRREWAPGDVLTHAGSNTMNFAVVWASVADRFAVLIATNVGGDDAARACDRAAAALITRRSERERVPEGGS